MDDCHQRGYRFACGGENSVAGLDLQGFFVPNTVVDDPPEDARVVQEERDTNLIYVIL